MKTSNIFTILLFIAVFIYACNSKQASKKTSPNTISDTTPVHQSIESASIPVDYENTKILKFMYALKRDSLDFKQLPDLSSKTLGKYGYGDRLQVIEIKTGWLGIMERITRRYIKNGVENEITGWEKVYVQTEYAGNIDAIKLNQQDLNAIVTEKQEGNKIIQVPGLLTKYIGLDLITKDEFESKRPTAVNYFVADTTAIKKKKGVIELPCANKVKRYIDKPDAEEQSEVYEYLGQISVLNKYVLSGTYYEAGDYKLVDKTTGEEVTSLSSFPNVSADKKYIIGLSVTGYDSIGDLQLFALDGNSIKLILSTSFKNWVPTDERSDIFWSTDGYFYVAVVHALVNENKSDGDSFHYQYLRIKVL